MRSGRPVRPSRVARPVPTSRHHITRTARRHSPLSDGDMSDTDAVSVARLISLVKERPVLWDRQEEVYKNRKLTRQAWTEICEALIDNYHDLGENEKLAIGRSIIGKWANLRDNWLRYWRKRQELLRVGSSTKSLKKYIHHDQLLFLSKVYDPDGQQEVEEIQVEVDVISDPEFESTIEFDETSQNSWNIPQYLHVSTTPPPQDPSERHLYFFHSIMPMICDFDNDQTLEFQSGVLDWVKRVKRREYVNVENCQCPSSQGVQEQIVCGKGFYKMRSSITCTPKLCHCNSTSKFAVKQEQKNCFFHPLDNSGFSESTSASNNSGGDTNFIEKEFKPNITINEQEFFSLKNIVTKLEKISETIESRVCDNGHDHLEKNFGSLLTQLPPKKIQSLKRKIVKECVREGFKKIQIGSIECFHTDRSNEPLELVQNASSVSEAPAIQSDNAKGLCSPDNKESSPSILRDTLQNLSVAPK